MTRRATPQAELLREAYVLVSELWCSPADADTGRARERAGEVVAGLRELDVEAAAGLGRFLDAPGLAEEEYVELFELDPQCALYLGAHVFEEPKVCAQAGVSDRNGYMLELLGTYRHLGFAPNGKELPDYLPLVIEALALTVTCDDPVRARLVKEHVQPLLPAMRGRLQEMKTPYRHLLDALVRLLQVDLALDPTEGHHE